VSVHFESKHAQTSSNPHSFLRNKQNSNCILCQIYCTYTVMLFSSMGIRCLNFMAKFKPSKIPAVWDIVTCRLQIDRYLDGSRFVFFFRFKQIFPDNVNLDLHLRSPVLYLLPHTVKMFKHVIFRKVVLFLHPVNIPNSVSAINFVYDRL